MGRKHNNAGKFAHEAEEIETRQISILDIADEISRGWTTDECRALKIAVGAAKPTAKYSRQWAAKKLGEILGNRFQGRIAIRALGQDDPEAWETIIEKLYAYAFSKATQVVEVESHRTEEHNINVTWNLDDPESVRRAYEKLFGAPAPFRLIEGGKKA